MSCWPRSGIAGSNSNCIFNYLGSFHTGFHSGCTIYTLTNSTQSFMLFHMLTSTCYFSFFFSTIPVGMKWYLIVVFTCISLMIVMLSIFSCACWSFVLSSVEKCLFKSFAYFSMGFCFFLVSHRSSLYVCILDLNPLPDVSCAIISSHPMGCLLTLLTVSVDAQKFVILKSNLSFFFIAYCQIEWHKMFPFCFPQRVLQF